MTLNQVANVLEKHSTLLREGANYFDSTNNVANLTAQDTYLTNQVYNTSASLNLGPLRRMWVALGCSYNDDQHISTATRESATLSSMSTSFDKSDSQQDTNRTSKQSDQSDSHAKLVLPKQDLKILTRRAPGSSILFCTFEEISSGMCVTETSFSTLRVDFEGRTELPELLNETHLSQLSISKVELHLYGDVHESPFLWLIDHGKWANIRTFSVQGLRFAKFSFHWLNQFTSLRIVRIRHNPLLEVTTENFTLADQVQSLFLNNNSMTTPRADTFDGMSKLRLLDLSNNRILNISSKLFSSLTSLRFCYLQHNSITHVAVNAFHSCNLLQTINLSFNFLASLSNSTFDGLSELYDLSLSSNPLSVLPFNLFSSLSRLHLLNMNNMMLKILGPKTFELNSELAVLSLEGNQLNEIHKEDFIGLKSLSLLRLNGNNLMSLDPELFQHLPSLSRLYCSDNKLTSIPAFLFQNNTLLRHLALDNNLISSFPEKLFERTENLELLSVSRNQIKSLDLALQYTPRLENLLAANNRLTAFHAALPNLLELSLSNNQIQTFPEHVTNAVNLHRLLLRNHRMAHFDLTPLLKLHSLYELDVSAASDIHSVATIDQNKLAHWSGNSLRSLQLGNVDTSALLQLKLPILQGRLRAIEIGWPKLNEKLFEISRLCGLLTNSVQHLTISNSGYRRMELCKGKEFSNAIVNLQENSMLHSLTIYGNVRQLNISDSRNLDHLDVLNVDVFDMSGTRLSNLLLLCTHWGRHMLFARRLHDSLFAGSVTESVFRQCLSTVDVMDLSENPGLNNPSAAHNLFGQRFVISSHSFASQSLEILPTRATLPTFQIQFAPIECGVHFEAEQVWELDANFHHPTALVEQLVFVFRCKCAQGHRLSSTGECRRELPDIVPAVLGAVSGGLALGLFIAWLSRHYRGLTRHLDLQKRLLIERDEEVIALKSAWEIPFEELKLNKRIAAGSFGIVFEAEWDTIVVAVKVLQENVMAFDDSTVLEFEREVEFLQRTRHPHVVRFFGAGTDPTGSPFLVLEYLALGSLRDFLKRDLETLLFKVSVKPKQNTPHVTGAWQPNDSFNEDNFGHSKLYTTGHSTYGEKYQHINSEQVWKLKMQLLQDVASGMAFVHSLDQVHR